jgi:TPP-dependent indolepyruvate ferredoxin oxidoreductase alpha subunit
VLVRVSPRVDAAGARALALHQLTCHMCHAWLLLYGCCCLMLLPSLLAWAKLPLGACVGVRECVSAGLLRCPVCAACAS